MQRLSATSNATLVRLAFMSLNAVEDPSEQTNKRQIMTPTNFEEQLRQLFADYNQVTKEQFDEQHGIVQAAKDLFEKALMDCSRPIVEESTQVKRLKAELAKVKKEAAHLKLENEKLKSEAKCLKFSNLQQCNAAKEVQCLKQEVRRLKKYSHQVVMKKQKAKYAQLNESSDKEVADLSRLYAEARAENEKLVSNLEGKKHFILQLFLENSELKEDVEKLTEENKQMREDFEEHEVQVTKTSIVHRDENDRNVHPFLHELKAALQNQESPEPNAE